MKKVFCVVMTFILGFCCCSAALAESPDADLGFAVASDLHVMPPVAELEKTNDDPMFWYANRRAAMENESGLILESFLNQCAADDSVEFVLISGDITDGGKFRPAEHEYAVSILRKFEAETGKQIYVTVGNHDICDDSEVSEYTTIDEFKEYYAEFGYDKALTVSETDGSYTADLGENYRLIALDSCDQTKSTADGMTSKRMNWVKAQADKAKEDGKYPILMMHHNLLEHMPMQTIISKDFIVGNHLSVAEKFANWGIKVVLTGHEHCSDATSYTSTKGNVITDFATTALSMYPLEYRVFSMNDEEITYTAKAVEKIDTAALAAISPDYTAEMLAAMDSDLNEFAKGFLKAGIQYRLALGMTEEKLGIPKDAIYYSFVMGVVGKLTGMLEMPLYGEENSVWAIGRKYGIEIPASEYKNGWDLATSVVAAHYEGSESLGVDSPEARILLRTVGLILREESIVIGDEITFNVGNKILEAVGLADAGNTVKDFCKSAFGRVNPAEYCITALLSPLLYGFTTDDSVDDNNGAIVGYGVNSSEVKSNNIKTNLRAFFDKIALYISMIFKYALQIFAW